MHFNSFETSLCTSTIELVLKHAATRYEAKFDSGNSTRQALFSLGWTVDELNHLMEEGRSLRVEIPAHCNIIKVS